MAGTREPQALDALGVHFPSLTTSHRPVRCIVKIGGVAITRKNEFETLNNSALATTTFHLREALGLPYASLPMDWSRKDDVLDMELLSDTGGQQLDFPSAFIVVHGAGSYGHFHASRSGVNKGDLRTPSVKAGFVATRISVTKLNHQIVRHFASEGIPAVSVDPFSAGWSTHKQVLKRDNVTEVRRAVDAGFVPVLHGDAVLDSAQGCTILSGDVVASRLAQVVKPSFVVFLTNVPGVFDRPPSDPDATLLREIVVFEDCSWTIVDPPFGVNNKTTVQTTVASHDTTGGMATKVAEAASIATMGIDVYIVEAGTPHALEALRGNAKNLKSKKMWLGTLVRSAFGRSS